MISIHILSYCTLSQFSYLMKWYQQLFLFLLLSHLIKIDILRFITLNPCIVFNFIVLFFTQLSTIFLLNFCFLNLDFSCKILGVKLISLNPVFIALVNTIFYSHFVYQYYSKFLNLILYTYCHFVEYYDCLNLIDVINFLYHDNSYSMVKHVFCMNSYHYYL